MKNFKLDINDEFLIKELVEKLALSEEDAKSYINFISVNSTVKTPGKTEAHHVLPKSIFPEYLKSTWNLVNLSHFNHFKYHTITTSIHTISLAIYLSLAFFLALTHST